MNTVYVVALVLMLTWPDPSVNLMEKIAFLKLFCFFKLESYRMIDEGQNASISNFEY